jgi:hypothetical protein
MKSEKKWLRKPACNPPISQEKAGFVTYSFLKQTKSAPLKKYEIAIGNPLVKVCKKKGRANADPASSPEDGIPLV